MPARGLAPHRLLPHPLAKEADDVVDAEAVEELGRVGTRGRGASRDRPCPSSTSGRPAAPSSDRQQRSRPAERRAETSDLELITMRPHVGALAADDERHIAHERAPARFSSTRAARHCSCASHCRYISSRTCVPSPPSSRGEVASASTSGERSRSGRPRRPAIAVVRRAERGVERVIAEPRCPRARRRRRSSRARALVRGEARARGSARNAAPRTRRFSARTAA